MVAEQDLVSDARSFLLPGCDSLRCDIVCSRSGFGTSSFFGLTTGVDCVRFIARGFGAYFAACEVSYGE